MDYTIDTLSVSISDLSQINKLLRQLTSAAEEISEDDIQEVLKSGGTILLFRNSQGAIVGILTMIIARKPTGRFCLLEDIVVDEEYRRHGIGKMLVLEAIERARKSGAKQIDLTSHPSREAANRLYPSLGFHLRDTNCYRLKL